MAEIRPDFRVNVTGALPPDARTCEMSNLSARISRHRLAYSLTVRSTLSAITAQPFPASW